MAVKSHWLEKPWTLGYETKFRALLVGSNQSYLALFKTHSGISRVEVIFEHISCQTEISDLADFTFSN